MAGNATPPISRVEVLTVSRPQDATMVYLHPAIAAGVCTTMDEVEQLAEAAARIGASMEDMVTAIGRTTSHTLADFARRIAIPQPEPDPRIFEHFLAMYGDEGTARRTAVATERLRSGWDIGRAALQAAQGAAAGG